MVGTSAISGTSILTGFDYVWGRCTTPPGSACCATSTCGYVPDGEGGSHEHPGRARRDPDGGGGVARRQLASGTAQAGVAGDGGRRRLRRAHLVPPVVRA